MAAPPAPVPDPNLPSPPIQSGVHMDGVDGHLGSHTPDGSLADASTELEEEIQRAMIAGVFIIACVRVLVCVGECECALSSICTHPLFCAVVLTLYLHLNGWHSIPVPS